MPGRIASRLGCRSYFPQASTPWSTITRQRPSASRRQTLVKRETTAPSGRSPYGRGDLAVLENAFLSIPDSETRNSIVALVCSLAPPNDPSRTNRKAS